MKLFEDDKIQIMVVEENIKFNDYLSTQLKRQNYEVISCTDKKEAYKALSTVYFNLIILSCNGSDDTNDLELLHFIRLQNKFLPIIVLSTLNSDREKVHAFAEGCDDYIVKPFSINELIYRTKRRLECFEQMNYEEKPISAIYVNGKFRMDVLSGQFFKNDEQIKLRKKQFNLMLYFMQNPNIMLPFNAIYENVWHEDVPSQSSLESTMYVNIRELRHLIEDDPKHPKHITSLSKFGYIFNPE